MIIFLPIVHLYAFIFAWATNVPLPQRILMISWAVLGKILPAGWGMGSFPSAQCWWGHPWGAGTSVGLPRTRGMWTDWRESREGPPGCWRTGASLLWGKAEGAWDCSAWSREGSGGLNPCLKNLQGGNEEEGARLFQWCPVPGQEAQTGPQEVPSKHQETLFRCEGDTGTGCPVRWCSLHHWSYSKTVWTWSGSGSPEQGGLNKMTREDLQMLCV